MLKNNLSLKVISLLIAIALWAFVIGEVNPVVKKTINNVPVELENMASLEERNLALASGDDYRISIIVEGERSKVNSLRAEDIKATADLYGYEKGENHVDVEVVLPNGVTLENEDDMKLTVMMEERVTAQFPVTVEFTGVPPVGMEPSAQTVVPKEVEVSGAKTYVDKVEAVVVRIDVENLTEAEEIHNAAPVAVNKRGYTVDDVSISATNVEVTAVLYYVKAVALNLKVTGSPDEEIGEAEVTVPKEVVIRGTKEAIQRVNSVTAENINIDDVKEDTVIPVELYLPSNVERGDSAKNLGVKIEFK